MSEIILTEKNFQQEVLNSDIPVLVDFWASWCGPCRMLAPTVEEIAEEYAGKVKVGTVNVDEEPRLAQTYGVASIPTLIVFDQGKIKNKSIGVRPKDSITDMFI